MKLNIGNSIRRLRQEKKLTQDELASAIGVSAQAVSKWERNEGYPDITLLPEIASFFGVSLDTLCGIDEKRNRLEIAEIRTRISIADTYDEGVRLARKGLTKYPYSHELKAALAFALTGCLERWTPPQETLLEIIALYEDILEHSTDQKLRNSAISELCCIYELAGNHKKALNTAGELSDFYHSSERVLAQVLQGEFLVSHVQSSIINILPQIDFMLRKALDTDRYSTEEKITLCEKMIAIYEIVGDCHDWSIGLLFSMMLYQKIAGYSIDLNNTIGCLDALKKAADLAVCADSLIAEWTPKSLLLNLIKFERLPSDPPKDRENLLREIEADRKFDPIRDSDEYKAILSTLTD